MIQSFPRRMAVPMAERLTMARLCLRPMPHHHPPTRRHFCRDRLPRPYPATPIFRFKVPACAPERNLANFYYLRPIFQPGPSAYTRGSASERKVAAVVVAVMSRLLIVIDASGESLGKDYKLVRFDFTSLEFRVIAALYSPYYKSFSASFNSQMHHDKRDDKKFSG